MPEPDLETLRGALARRLQETAELEVRVRAVQARFQAEVAPLREEVLRLQMERLKEKAQARRRSARLRNAYHDAQDAYVSFRETQAAARSGSPEDTKATYRRATKQCHPDAVAASYRDEAAATFCALESAYDADQHTAVQAIAEILDDWGFPPGPSASTDLSATQEASHLKAGVAALDASIENLRASTAYEVLQASEETDIAAMVGALKRSLRRRLRQLKRDRTAQR